MTYRWKSCRLAIIPVLCCGILSGCSLTPKVVDNKVQHQNTFDQVTKIWNKQKKIDKEIGLSQALARTLKYNLQNKVSQSELMLASGNLSLAYLEMLPAINLESKYTFRNNAQIQNLTDKSGNIIPGKESYTPKTVLNSSARLQWNILDLGLSYTRAQQQGDRVLYMQEQSRKTLQSLIQETTSAYWKAWAAQEMLPRVKAFKLHASEALKKSKSAVAQKVSGSDEQINYQNMLIKSIRKANKLILEISDAKSHLSRLMNAKQSSQYHLLPPSQLIKSLPKIEPQFEKFDLVALLNRPELLGSSYKVRISEKGVRAAVLEMLPGLRFDYGYNHTNNEFMLNKSWVGGDVALSLGLLNTLMFQPQVIRNAKATVEFEKLKQAAATVTVLTQIRVAYMDYLLWKNDYHYANEEAKTSAQLYKLAVARQAANQGHSQKTFALALASLNSDFDKQITFANAYDALSKLYQSVGLDMLSPKDRFLPLSELSKKLEVYLQEQSKGSFNQVVNAAYNKLKASS